MQPAGIVGGDRVELAFDAGFDDGDVRRRGQHIGQREIHVRRYTRGDLDDGLTNIGILRFPPVSRLAWSGTL